MFITIYKGLEYLKISKNTKHNTQNSGFARGCTFKVVACDKNQNRLLRASQ